MSKSDIHCVLQWSSQPKNLVHFDLHWYLDRGLPSKRHLRDDLSRPAPLCSGDLDHVWALLSGACSRFVVPLPLHLECLLSLSFPCGPPTISLITLLGSGVHSLTTWTTWASPCAAYPSRPPWAPIPPPPGPSLCPTRVCTTALLSRDLQTKLTI